MVIKLCLQALPVLVLFPMKPALLIVVGLKLLMQELAAQPLTVFPDLKGHIFSFINNDAALASSESVAGGIFFQRMYMVEGISNLTAAVIIQGKPGGFGFALSRYGSDEFNESSVSLGYGRKLMNALDAGAHLQLQTVKIKGYENHMEPGFAVSFRLHPLEKLMAGFCIAKSKSSYDYYFRINYEVSSSLVMESLVEKHSIHPSSLKAVIVYQPVKEVRVSLSIMSATEVLSMGIAWINPAFRVEVFSNYNRYLGYSPGLSLQFNARKKK